MAGIQKKGRRLCFRARSAELPPGLPVTPNISLDEEFIVNQTVYTDFPPSHQRFLKATRQAQGGRFEDFRGHIDTPAGAPAPAAAASTGLDGTQIVTAMFSLAIKILQVDGTLSTANRRRPDFSDAQPAFTTKPAAQAPICGNAEPDVMNSAAVTDMNDELWKWHKVVG
ncbi:hypothetical protein HDU77_001329, partial [Chytriomyces hyalinus]